MSRRFVLVLAGALILDGSVLPNEDKKKEDGEAIQGTWIIQSGGDATGGTMVFKRSEITMQFPKNKDAFKGTFKLDPTKNPKQIDLQMKGGELNRGIYVLDGDTLKIFAVPGPDRPSTFPKDSSPGLVVLKRKKP
jgi:uncharacterized protein (TIGR03067 family)